MNQNASETESRSWAELKATLDRLGPRGDSLPAVVFISGASGSGKTHLVNYISERVDHPNLGIHFFDRIGVLSHEEMVAKHGSGENWQRDMTIEWVRRFREEHLTERLVIFEGQYDLDFAEQACRAQDIQDYRLVVATVPDSVMAERLEQLRNQPELVTQDMRNWSAFLRKQGESKGALIIDTSVQSTEQSAEIILSEANRLLLGSHAL